MYKCYKVTNFLQGSAIISIENKFYRQYSTKDIVDMGMVFRDLDMAKHFVGRGRQYQIWLAECSFLTELGVICMWTDDYAIGRFWDSDGYTAINESPEGTHIGFDILLIKRVK